MRRLSETRVRESLRWAKELGADYLILHTNYIPLIRELPTTHTGSLHIDFFAGLPADSVTVLLENMWDPSPDLAVRLVEELDSDRLRLCFDVAHWNVHATVSMREWFARAGAYTPYVQLGDNNGDCVAGSVIGSGSGCRGRALAMPRCGRCWLWWCSYSRSACIRWAWFQMRVRSSSSWRQAWIQRSMIECMRGISDAATHDCDSGVGEDRVEQGKVLAVPIPDQVLRAASRVLKVHSQVPVRLGHPSDARVGGGAEDADLAGGVVDDRQDAQAGAVSVVVSTKSAAMMACAWERRNVAQVVAVRWAPGRCRPAAGSPRRWRRRPHTQDEEFAMDAAVSPVGAFAGQA